MNRFHRLGWIAVAAAIAVAAFALLRDAGPDDEPDASRAPAPPAVTATAPAATAPPPSERPRPAVPVLRVGSTRTIAVRTGERVRFVVRSPTADEVHVHGYDLTKAVPAGGHVRFDFRATLEGRFEIELHEAGVAIGAIEVRP